MKGHLIKFSPNDFKSITENNKLFEIQVLVSRVTVFDEIHENLYLRKSPCPNGLSQKSIQLI